MAVLDELSGFEFEDVMEDVFRNLGYENVRQAVKTADEGRDVTMEEVVDGTRRAIVVECKHTGTVGRPVVQKLHSAIATYQYDGPKRGMVVTTGRFTGPATEYANRLERHDDPYPIELIDGRDLREIADAVGLDLYNGRIEILCEETLRPVDPTGDVDTPIREAIRDVGNIDSSDLPATHVEATFEPAVAVEAGVDAVFETSVGVIHRIDETNRFVVHASREQPREFEPAVRDLISANIDRTVQLESESFETTFDSVTIKRFGQTETGYKEWAVERLRRQHTTTVTYTGDNNVTYNKTCEPKGSDIVVQSVSAVYVPELQHSIRLGEYGYTYESYVAGPSRVTVDDGIHRCVHCAEEGGPFTYCDNCGSINCGDHSKTERLEGEPVCTGCAVTERFAFKRKYFYDESNLEAFREQYSKLPIHRKAMENKPLVAAMSALVLLFGLVLMGGFL